MNFIIKKKFFFKKTDFFNEFYNFKKKFFQKNGFF